MTFGRVTVEVSSHHVHWGCNAQAGGCGETNDITQKTCGTCKKTRCAGDDALAKTPEDPVSGKRLEIGYLDHVDENGEEHWYYFDPNAKRQSQIGNN